MISRFVSWFLSLFKKDMDDENLIWYLAYGSNLNENRFLFYILGGTPNGQVAGYDGCRDTSLPRKKSNMIISHELYFAESSVRWENGGVAFIKNEKNANIQTYCRMYLITRQQMEDIAKQETGSESYLTIDFEEAIQNGSTIFKDPSWYGKMLYLGNKDKYPVFTITSRRLRTFTTPGQRYISIIASGIRETFKLADDGIITYFKNKNGVTYSAETLASIVSDSRKL